MGVPVESVDVAVVDVADQDGTTKLAEILRSESDTPRCLERTRAPRVCSEVFRRKQVAVSVKNVHHSTAQECVQIHSPKKNLQIKMLRTLPGGSEFVAYLDALGEVDGQHCLIDWKTTTSRYSTEPEGLLSLDPQLICYSWISGIPEVSLVVFVRKHAPEIQYLRASISEEQRQEFGRLVETTISQIEAAQFVSHSGIRFPQNGCLSCPHLGLCLNNQPLIDTNLVRKAGASDLDWLDELVD
jgi:hypothetical protein